MMPAIGFAILINVIAKRSILPFYFLGFFVVEIFSVSALQLACLGRSHGGGRGSHEQGRRGEHREACASEQPREHGRRR